MGNEHSQNPSIQIDEKAIEVSDFWTHHTAFIGEEDNVVSSNVTVFISDLLVQGPLWTHNTPLEKCCKNLMIYRHPCIVKYITSWKNNSRYFLAVEEVKPLSHILPKLSTLQICVGLHSILKALCFLHEKAGVSHNNVCISSIYVTEDGSNWKLGGMEYLCKYKDLTLDYLNKSKSHRYSKAIDCNEEKYIDVAKNRKDFIDLFAYVVLVNEVLKSKDDDDEVRLSAFKALCKTIQQTIEVLERPKLASLLEHEFFLHESITIHSFLVELPLKNDEEKREFFSTLVGKLQQFDEHAVGSQLGGLLLSRMVLLNKHAQSDLLPYVLCPAKAEECIFSEATFKQYMVPKLLEIFSVRDAQIRLLLLNYFPFYMVTFTTDQLQSDILPELLLGIKDTNDHLVSVTLHTLADLVPILGSATVIGGKRAKLFNDGRPTCIIRKQKASLHVINSTVDVPASRADILNQTVVNPLLPERQRPDGEENDISTEETDQLQMSGDDMDNWDDWDNNLVDQNETSTETMEINEFNTDVNTKTVITESKTVKRLSIRDISELDIKSQVKNELGSNEMDFFQDMEPVIDKSSKFVVDFSDVSKKLALNVEDAVEEGWGNDEDGWE